MTGVVLLGFSEEEKENVKGTSLNITFRLLSGVAASQLTSVNLIPLKKHDWLFRDRSSGF